GPQAPVQRYGWPQPTAPQYAWPQGPGAIQRCVGTQPVAQPLSQLPCPYSTLPAPAQPDLPPRGVTSRPQAVPAGEATPRPPPPPPTAPPAAPPTLPPPAPAGAGDSGSPLVDGVPRAGEGDQPRCPGCGLPGNPGRFYADTEYLLWWFKKGATPPLVTTSP